MNAESNPYTRGIAAHAEVCAYCTQGMHCAQMDRMRVQESDYAASELGATVTTEAVSTVKAAHPDAAAFVSIGYSNEAGIAIERDATTVGRAWELLNNYSAYVPELASSLAEAASTGYALQTATFTGADADGINHTLTVTNLDTHTREGYEIGEEPPTVTECQHCGEELGTDTHSVWMCPARAHYDIVVIRPDGEKSVTRFPVSEISQANVNRALAAADRLVSAIPDAVLGGVYGVRDDAQTLAVSDAATILTMVGRDRATASEEITERATELGMLRTTETPAQSVTVPLPLASFRAAAEGNGWLFATDDALAIGPDGSVFEVKHS